MTRAACLVAAAILAVFPYPSFGQSGANPSPGMKMPMAMADEPAHFKPTTQAYTENRQFLIKLQQVPQPIPYEQYFDLRFAVFDGHDPKRQLTNADLTVSAGMRHGLKHGFAHGMQSSPKIENKDGVFTVSGMYFHMMGEWGLELTAKEGGKAGTAYFRLPCCGK